MIRKQGRKAQRIAELTRAQALIAKELRALGGDPTGLSTTYAPPDLPRKPFQSWQDAAHHNQHLLEQVIRECGTRHITHALSMQPREEAA